MTTRVKLTKPTPKVKLFLDPWVRSGFHSQKCASRKRSVPFMLSYEQWFEVWYRSGHILERGRCLGQYCMSRKGDKGPYAVGNVRIVTCSANHREARLGKPLSSETCRKLSEIFTGRKFSALARQRMSVSARNRGNNHAT